jgi:RpiB/LacA/LacB family sugar-phosphate isomerase
MRVAIACDHAGFPYKTGVASALGEQGHQVVDLGTFSREPVDYPDYARLVGVAVRDGAADLGILICGSGAGVAIAANKLRGVRAALCHDLFTARQAREDDDANVLCLGARVVDLPNAVALAQEFVAARFSGEERHMRRLAKVLAIERDERSPRADAATAPRDVLGEPAVAASLGRLERLETGARLWRRDATLWDSAPAATEAIRHRLGWLDSPELMRGQLSDLAAFARSVHRDGVRDVLLLGMGGSSLAAEVLAQAFGPAPGAPALAVLDTTDPAAVRATRERLDLGRTLFLVSSKSGTTTEMLALYRFFRAELERPETRVPSPGRHFVAITDPGTPLERLAKDGAFRHIFLNPPDIGGRFSALSYFGLVPAALLGIDAARLLDSAAAMAAACGPRVPARDNPGLRLGAVLGGLAEAGRDKVTLVLAEPIRTFGAWLEQLLTESTGKQGRGLVVVQDEPLAGPAAYGSDRLFVTITLADDPGVQTPLGELERAGHPVVRLSLADRDALGGEFFRWEVATAAVGALFGVNPFDEPNVAQAKEATQAALATFKERARLPEWPIDTAEDLARVLAQARPGDYVALLAYLTPEAATVARLGELRRLIRGRTGLATTVGFGPRYLHSTGQLHKGGPPTPILVLLAPQDQEDLPIPGERFGFATLMMAQALGDLATLRAANRRALWLSLGGPAPDALERLHATLTKTLG